LRALLGGEVFTSTDAALGGIRDARAVPRDRVGFIERIARGAVAVRLGRRLGAKRVDGASEAFRLPFAVLESSRGACLYNISGKKSKRCEKSKSRDNKTTFLNQYSRFPHKNKTYLTLARHRAKLARLTIGARRASVFRILSEPTWFALLGIWNV
jgi:hypothetical protein